MIQCYPDEGLAKLLRMIADNNGDGLLWALYVNDVDPDPENELADFTLAAAWGKVTLDSSDFVLEQVVAHVATIQANTINLENDTGGPIDVYGWLVVEPNTQTLLMVNRAIGAPVTVADGATFPLTPVLGDYSDLSVPIVDGGTF